MSRNITTFICERTVEQSPCRSCQSVTAKQVPSVCGAMSDSLGWPLTCTCLDQQRCRKPTTSLLEEQRPFPRLPSLIAQKKEPDKTTESRAMTETRQRSREGSYRGNVMFVMCFLFVLTFLGRRQRMSRRDWAQSRPGSVKQTEQNQLN